MKSYLGIIPKYYIAYKKRTIFTVIVIILSIMLLTAFSLMSDGISAGNYDYVVDKYFTYHALVTNVTKEQVETISKDSRVEKTGLIDTIGDYSLLDSKATVKLQSGNHEVADMLGIKLIEGAMPLGENDILLDDSICDNEGNQLKIGDSVTLSNGNIKKQYIVCGLYKNKDILEHAALISNENTNKGDCIIKLQNGVKVRKAIPDILEQIKLSSDNQVFYNQVLLKALGQDVDRGMVAVKAIFSGIIILATLASVYNIFYISVVERVRHYGILRSVGAAPKHIRRIVILEGIILSLMALPFGLVLGTVLAKGIFIYMPDVMSKHARFVLSVNSFIYPTILGIITIFLCTLKPAFMASRISPTVAVSNTGFKITKDSVKPRRWHVVWGKLFGVSGFVAYRNILRNKKKFFVTVFSMSLCTIIFIVFSYFVSLSNSVTEQQYVLPNSFSAGLRVLDYHKMSGFSDEDYENIKRVDGIEKVNKLRFSSLNLISDKEDAVGKNEYSYSSDPDKISVPCYVWGMDNDKIQTLAPSKGDVNQVLTKDGYNALIATQGGLAGSCQVGENIELFSYDSVTGNTKHFKAMVSGIINNYPGYYDGPTKNVCIIFNNHDFEKMFGCTDYQKFEIYTKDDADRDVIEGRLADLLKNNPNSQILNYDRLYKDSIKKSETVRRFYIGAIFILALICIFSIFSSISAGLIIRTREFSTMRAIGMTYAQLRKNVWLEGLLHGVVSSIWGGTIGLVLSYAIYRLMNQSEGYMLHWTIPYNPILITIIINISICVIATLPPLRRVSQTNIIDGIRMID